MWELDHKKGWAPKNWCFCTVVLEKTLESPLNYKTKPVYPKGNQSWIFIGRTDAEAETPILRTPDVKNWLTGKRPLCWERLKTGREEEDRGWDGWMATLTRWTWVWASSSSWWWTGRPCMLQSMGSQRVGHNWATELIRTVILGSQNSYWKPTIQTRWRLHIIKLYFTGVEEWVVFLIAL